MKFNFKQSLSSIFDYVRRRPNTQNVSPDPTPYLGKYVADQAVKCPPVAISMKEVVQAVSTQPPMYKSRELRKVFTEPNPIQSWQELFISALNSYLLFGAAYLHATRTSGGRVIELAELPADEMKFIRDGSRYYWEREGDGERFDYRDICFIRDFLGLSMAPVSRVEPVWPDVMAVNNSYGWVNQAFLNGLNVKTAVSFTGSVGDRKLARIKARLENDFTGDGAKRGGFVVVDKDAKVTELKGLSPADMDMQRFMQSEIRIAAAVFGAPPFSVGSGGETKYSNHAAETSRFLRSGINPITERFSDGLTRFLGNEVAFDEKALYKGDLRSLMDIIVDAVETGILSRDEGRILLQYDAMKTEEMSTPSVASFAPGPNRAKSQEDPDSQGPQTRTRLRSVA